MSEKGPWYVLETDFVDDRIEVNTGARSEHDARRLAACWNACEGVPTESLEKEWWGHLGDKTKPSKLMAQRDALLAACKALVEAIEGHERRTGVMQMHPAVERARAAVAQAEATTDDD